MIRNISEQTKRDPGTIEQDPASICSNSLKSTWSAEFCAKKNLIKDPEFRNKDPGFEKLDHGYEKIDLGFQKLLPLRLI